MKPLDYVKYVWYNVLLICGLLFLFNMGYVIGSAEKGDEYLVVTPLDFLIPHIDYDNVLVVTMLSSLISIGLVELGYRRVSEYNIGGMLKWK